MKKLIAALVLVAAVHGTAFAQFGQVPVRLVHENVKFRTSASNNAGFVDSLVAKRVGAAGASSVLDTTAAISTQGWHFWTGLNVTDTSNVFCQLTVFDAPGSDACQTGADSLAAAMQVSANGEDWLTVAAITGQTVSAGTNPIASRNNQTIANGAFMDRLSLNGAALANGQPVWVFRYKIRPAQTLGGSVAEGDVQMFPYIRFILSLHDAAGYKIAAKVSHFAGAER